MKDGFAKFIDSPFLSVSIFILVLIASLTTIVYNFVSPKDRTIVNYSFAEDADYFIGDIPPMDDGNFDFPKMKKVFWQSGAGWISTEELLKIANSEFIWVRAPALSLGNHSEIFALLQHQGVVFEVFTDTGHSFFKFGDFNDPKSIPKVFESKFSWIQIPLEESEYYYIRLYHNKSFLFAIPVMEKIAGNRDAVFRKFAINNFTFIFIHAFFFMIGLICALVYFIEFKKRYDLVLDFAIFCLLFGIFGLSSNSFLLYVFENQTPLIILNVISSNFIFIPMLSGLRRLFPNIKIPILPILIYINIALAVSSMIFTLSISLSDSMYLLLIEMLPFFMGLIVFIILMNISGPIFASYIAWKAGNTVAKGHFIGFCITLVLVIIEMAYSITDQFGFNRVALGGVLFGVISQGFALERAIFANRQQAQFYKEDLLKAEKSLKESQLKSLQTKMNPHYLFNSLNTIHALHKIKPELIADAILSLANNYRFISDRTDRDWIPFEEEWSFLQDYLHLQKLRFYDTIQIDFKKTGDFSSVILPPLLLQPIIENSFKHGFRGSAEEDFHFQLFIHAKMIKDSVFCFVVYDNGIGIPEELLADKTKLLERSLGNIKERLKNLYSEFSFEVRRNFPEGARTEIEIILTSRVPQVP
ncbi:sensor histidine kinase [Leptospira brenneri]|uniref:Histidine kinase n=1 Tax=Leptospira brenneri TaxID=2023182 RepID=A0A2M9Y788_9LEPT|nr:histidine kinase [Leptospira brenneri]PJZ47286.1 histidine kinase [Leptospira brenneri]TGK95745.1 histidine kinase [Leptospira brenneri]